MQCDAIALAMAHLAHTYTVAHARDNSSNIARHLVVAIAIIVVDTKQKQEEIIIVTRFISNKMHITAHRQRDNTALTCVVSLSGV